MANRKYWYDYRQRVPPPDTETIHQTGRRFFPSFYVAYDNEEVETIEIFDDGTVVTQPNMDE